MHRRPHLFSRIPSFRQVCLFLLCMPIIAAPLEAMAVLGASPAHPSIDPRRPLIACYLAFVLAGIPVYYITQRNEGAPTGVQGEFSRELRVRSCVCADDVVRVLWESGRAGARTACARHGLGGGGDGRGRAVGDADTCSIAFGRARVYFWEGRIWTEVFLDPWILRKCNEACCSALQRALAGRQVNVSRSLS